MSKAEELATLNANCALAWIEGSEPYKFRMETAAHLRALEANRQMLVGALRVAVRQNSHDMLMTGDELRAAEAALEQAKELT